MRKRKILSKKIPSRIILFVFVESLLWPILVICELYLGQCLHNHCSSIEYCLHQNDVARYSIVNVSYDKTMQDVHERMSQILKACKAHIRKQFWYSKGGSRLIREWEVLGEKMEGKENKHFIDVTTIVSAKMYHHQHFDTCFALSGKWLTNTLEGSSCSTNSFSRNWKQGLII